MWLVLCLIWTLFLIVVFLYWSWGLIVWEPASWAVAQPVQSKRWWSSAGWRTGDVVLFSGDSFGQASIRALTASHFDHCALVVVAGGMVYLYEADVGQGYHSGARVIALATKLERWRGYRWMVRIPLVQGAVPQDKLQQYISQHLDTSICPNRSLMRYICSKLLPRAVGESRRCKFCSELVHECLASCGVVQEGRSYCISPGDMFGIDKWCRQGYEYGGAELLVF